MYNQIFYTFIQPSPVTIRPTLNISKLCFSSFAPSRASECLVLEMNYGEIFMLSELSQISDYDRKCVRVTGFVTMVDFPGRMCQITHKEHNLIVDATLVDITMLRLDSLCQIIGELRSGTDKVRS